VRLNFLSVEYLIGSLPGLDVPWGLFWGVLACVAAYVLVCQGVFGFSKGGRRRQCLCSTAGGLAGQLHHPDGRSGWALPPAYYLFHAAPCRMC
jgi:hypothetical protein